MYLLAKDTVNGASGKVVITKDGKNYEVAGMRNIRALAGIQSSDMRVIGTKKIQNKPNGATQTITGNAYYGLNFFIDLVLKYVNQGIMDEFDIQITNNDPGTSIGTQIMAYYGCHLTGDIPLSILDNEEAMMNFDFNIAYTRVARLQAFNEPAQLGSV